ncbi:pitrilysin family protein [Silanimonas sp.]|uniref:M16 family metallopeptidase n=1 Tax=Silanimonas sp. TaxID=1929290 RepID=UPI0022CC1540|nr:pitrilysin family protein [Silanimonas sp.]MCZ8114660.1 pitrilysin family protein [Silanimonas sp.]
MPLLRPLAIALAASLALAGCQPASDAGSPAAAPAETNVQIPYETFTLPNGLRVVVHTDRKAPIVAVNVWYHVGSKDEEPGRTGFAHLFEHLMFQGSENWKGEFFEPFEQVGATDQNGTTNNDRTNYFQNVPTTALDLALWMESDRMGHFAGAISEDLLDEQRGVVQNEKRQGENQPYGRVWDFLAEKSYPEGHPYSWGVIGSMADLNAASIEDVKRWFSAWYGPNNAVLVLAGDIDVETAKAKAEQFFGHIPAGPTMPQPALNVAARTESTRFEMSDRVPQARLYRTWNTPQFGTADAQQLSLLAQVLAGSRSSRLDKRLVFGEQLADSVSAFSWGSQLSGMFMLQVDIKQGVDPARVEAIVNEEMAKLLAEGPTAAEIDQARTVFKAGFIRGVERIGGFGGKADVLAECTVFTGDPGCYRNDLDTLDAATPASVQAAGKTWLAQGDLTLLVTPGDRPALVVDESTAREGYVSPPIPAVDPKFTTVASAVDRSAGPPMPASFPALSFPALQRATLSNGIKLVVAERPGLPVVQMNMLFGGGFAADQGRKLGTSSFAMGMLDEGAGDYDALQFGDRVESLGAQLGSSAGLDDSSAFLSALTENLDASVALYADMLRRPRFAPEDIERVRAQWLASIKQEKARPNALANRLLPPLMYGAGHPYAIPFSGSGTEASIASLTADDLKAYHADFVRPDNATLIVVGDTTIEAITPILEKHFGDWKAPATPVPQPTIAEVALPTAPRVYLVDQPGAIQATILAGQLAPSTTDDGSVEFDIANSVLGGEFSSRLNMNLREDKSWAYGAYSFSSGAKGQRPWIAFAPVQIDKTADALKEMQREITAYADGSTPATAEEVAKIQATEIRSLPGSFETANAVLGQVGGIVRYNRPDNWVEVRRGRIEALDPAGVNAAAKTLDPKALTWVVVGDLSKIEAEVRALNLGEVRIIDADGNPVGDATAAR